MQRNTKERSDNWTRAWISRIRKEQRKRDRYT